MYYLNVLSVHLLLLYSRSSDDFSNFSKDSCTEPLESPTPESPIVDWVSMLCRWCMSQFVCM